MSILEDRIKAYLNEREENLLIRKLTVNQYSTDFTSNDYLGLSRSAWIQNRVKKELKCTQIYHSGSTGSRLLSGNYYEIEALEKLIAQQFKSEEALYFTSGYSANTGLLSTLPQKGDVVIYDEHIHASLHQGLKLSKADKTAFKHNDIADLKKQLSAINNKVVFVVIESLYSMDGDYCSLKEIAELKKQIPFHLIVDEAHAGGVVGNKGEGLVASMGLETECLARIFTFGKAFGSHGAAIVSSKLIKDYLINFCKPFIYTTAPPLHENLTVKHSILFSQTKQFQRIKLLKLIKYFTNKKNTEKHLNFIGEGPIFAVVLGSNFKAKALGKELQKRDIDARPILSPTVPKGTERIRICLHAYNTPQEIDLLFEIIKEFHA